MSSITNLADPTQSTNDQIHDTFRITGTSMLDALWTWVSRTSLSPNAQTSQQQCKKPKWATTTHGTTTTLWTVSSGGTLKEYAQICWNRSAEKRVLVKRNGIEMDADQMLVKSKGLFASNSSRTFTLEDGTAFKWKSGAPAGSPLGLGHPSYGRLWHCVVGSGSSSNPSRLVATISPPQAGFVRSEFNLYCSLSASSSPSPPSTSTAAGPSRSPSPQPPTPAVEAIQSALLLTSILMSTHRDDHKSVQSPLSSSELEAKLIASALGTLPPYLPSGANNDRRLAADAQTILPPSSSSNGFGGGLFTESGRAVTTRSRSAQASPSSTPRTTKRSSRRPSTASGVPSDPPPYARLEPPSSLRRRPKEDSDGYTAPRPSRRPATSSTIR